MTVKENLIKMIIDIDDKKAEQILNIVTDYIWDNIEEVEPTEEEKIVIEKYLAGDEDYVVN